MYLDEQEYVRREFEEHDEDALLTIYSKSRIRA